MSMKKFPAHPYQSGYLDGLHNRSKNKALAGHAIVHVRTCYNNGYKEGHQIRSQKASNLTV